MQAIHLRAGLVRRGNEIGEKNGSSTIAVYEIEKNSTLCSVCAWDLDRGDVYSYSYTPTVQK